MSWMEDQGAPLARRTFAALRFPNYRLWFIGQMVSLFGTWMQAAAQGYLVFELTGSREYLGWVAFAAGLPSWLFMLWAGVIADRVSRRAMLVVTQIAMMAIAIALAALTFADLIRPWHVLALAAGLGIANAFEAPARHSFVLELVDRDDLGNAIALNSILFNAAVAIGPAAGGLVYAFVGPGWCFTLNAVSFVAVLSALVMMRLPPRAAERRCTTPMADLLEGLRYVIRHRTILVTTGIIAVVALFGISYVALLPAWAKTVLHGDATTNGLLQSARGVGAVGCALFIASLGRFRRKGRLLTVGTFALPATMLLFAGTRWQPLSLIALVGVGASLILVFNLSNTLVQELSDDALRGRVMSVYSFTFFGFLPIGSLGAGALAERIGESWTVAIGAGVSLICAAAVWIGYPALRRSE